MVGEMARFQLTPLISIRAGGKLENAPRANTSRGHVSLVDLINFGQRGCAALTRNRHLMAEYIRKHVHDAPNLPNFFTEFWHVLSPLRIFSVNAGCSFFVIILKWILVHLLLNTVCHRARRRVKLNPLANERFSRNRATRNSRDLCEWGVLFLGSVENEALLKWYRNGRNFTRNYPDWTSWKRSILVFRNIASRISHFHAEERISACDPYNA